jgi:hypothetical protein
MASAAHGSAISFSIIGETIDKPTRVTKLSRLETGEDQFIEVPHLGQTTGEQVATTTPGLVTPGVDTANSAATEFQVDFIGASLFKAGESGSFSITGLSGSGTCEIVSSSLNYALNDVVRGSVTFRVLEST